MATSGSYDYNLSAGQIIQAAYEDLGMITAGQPPSAADITMAMARLNMIVKQYQGNADGSPGIKIHTRQRVTFITQKGKQTYHIGPASTDAPASTQMGRTTLSAATATSIADLVVSKTTDTTSYPGTTLTIKPGDYLGVQLDNGTVFWSTVTVVLSLTVTLAAGLPSPASSGNYVWWFTTRAQRFPVLEAAVLRSENFDDTPLEVYTEVLQYEYGVSKKLVDGTPTAMLWEPLRTNTRITFNSVPVDTTNTVVLTVLYPSEDYDATTDEIAYPQEALRFLSWELAFAIAPSFGRWTKEMEANRLEAKAMYMTLNPETSILYFQCGGE